MALRKAINLGEGQQSGSLERDLVFIKLGKQEVPAAGEVGPTRLVDAQTPSKEGVRSRSRRAPSSRRSAPWETTEENQLKSLSQHGQQVTSVSVSDLGSERFRCVRYSAPERSSRGSFRRRSLRRRPSGSEAISDVGSLTISPRVVKSVGFLLYSWSASESTAASGSSVFNNSGQLVGILYVPSSGKPEVISWSGAMAEELSNSASLHDLIAMYGYGKLQEEITKGNLTVQTEPTEDDAVLSDAPTHKALQDSLLQAATRMEEGAMTKLAKSQLAQQVRLLHYPKSAIRRLNCHRHSMYL